MLGGPVVVQIWFMRLWPDSRWFNLGLMLSGFGSELGIDFDQLWFHVLWIDCIGLRFGSVLAQLWVSFGSARYGLMLSRSALVQLCVGLFVYGSAWVPPPLWLKPYEAWVSSDKWIQEVMECWN